jgi:membrane protease YdiL (CAAX protease family)
MSKISEKMDSQPQENPEDLVPVVLEEPGPLFSEIAPEEDNKWFGVPPKGDRPLPGKWTYVIMVLFIMLGEIGIWAIYRYATAPLFVGFGTELFYIAHIIAAPTIHIIPILLFWRYFRRESGLPFVFTKKLIMSGVIVGFIAAILWRFLEEVIYDGVAGMAGGVVPGTFSFFNLMDSSTILILSLMTFVHFFIVGPVEELEFRGFAQDQASRVLPNYQALVFSSILFGCSHIPIALFVYQFPPHIFVVAFIGWISAGFVFGALFIWSRNIFACIIMHGMGNWQLSVFYFQSTELIGGMDSFTTVLVGTISSIIADAIIIVFFYFIHKYYWQPHRRGEPAFGGMFIKVQDFIHDHDFNDKPIQTTATFLTAFCVLIMVMLMGVTAAFGETDLSKLSTATVEDSQSGGLGKLDSFIEANENLTGSGMLNEGQSDSITVTSGLDKYINKIKITMTWTDEPNNTPYENQPDTFSVTITGPNSSDEISGSNSIGGSATITKEIGFTYSEVAELISTQGDEYGVECVITLEEAGNQEGPFIGLLEQPDTGNDYEYTIEIIWLVPEE